MRAWWTATLIGAWVGSMLLSVGSGSKSAQPLSQDAKSSLSRAYYDARERLAATLTFEWSESGWAHVPARATDAAFARLYVQAEQAGEANTSIGTFVTLSVPEVDIFTEVSGYYIIERVPERLRLRIFGQAINLEQARNPQAENSAYHEDLYFQGNTVTAVSYGEDGAVVSVELAESGEKDVLGLGSPSGTDDPCMLMFLGGVSPLRLMGSSPPQWRLSSVTPEEWVFERINESEEMPKVRVHFDRRYQDAPSRLEIAYPDGDTRTWRTLKYKRILGMWFPSEVERVCRGGYGQEQVKYTLVRAFRTKEVRLEIPEGAPTRDRRNEGLSAWGLFETLEEATSEEEELEE